ncbi:28S ribosomal protein S29, mitochondrial [Cephus cinctus]|uniref:Small ribosomal subunit protein mS29 n=1 Tax=Cephus cinctus TaxID=211228 RepID=A0AAJ7BTG5_CEPCN|nr:28S ribosomal protein S29, mitochondrial [Cephus cinctus]
MVFYTQSLLRRITSGHVRMFGTALEAIKVPEEPPQTFRTIENNPANHTIDHMNRFYTIAPEIQKQLFQHGGLTKFFQKQVKTFAECSILIRQPAIEIISYIRQSDYSKPPNKYVLYGEFGVGKSTTLVHLIHYAFATRKILIHVPWAQNWFSRPRETANSIVHEGNIDLPIDAAAWLVHFKNQNHYLLSELDLRVTKDYAWSHRETTSNGTPLLEMINFGINRIKFASEIINVLINELKEASRDGKCSTMVAIDGYNAFFSEYSAIRDDNKKVVPPSRVSLTHAFLNITKSDWCNGIIVVAVDILATKDRRESYLPRFLLNKEGFEHMDPFLPVHVKNYTTDEFEIIAEYYKNRKWIRDISKQGLRELQLLSQNNPYKFMEYCTPL